MNCLGFGPLKTAFLFLVRSLPSEDAAQPGGRGHYAELGTRVPIESLFDHLEAGVTLDEFLDDFPTVTKAQAVALLDCANRLLNTKHIDQLYAAVA